MKTLGASFLLVLMESIVVTRDLKRFVSKLRRTVYF